MHGNHAIVFSHLLLVAMKLLIFFSLVILNKMTNKSDVYTRLTAQMMQYNIHSFLTDRHVLCCHILTISNGGGGGGAHNSSYTAEFRIFGVAEVLMFETIDE